MGFDRECRERSRRRRLKHAVNPRPPDAEPTRSVGGADAVGLGVGRAPTPCERLVGGVTTKSSKYAMFWAIGVVTRTPKIDRELQQNHNETHNARPLDVGQCDGVSLSTLSPLSAPCAPRPIGI